MRIGRALLTSLGFRPLSLQAEVGGLVNSGSHAASELYELRVTVEELKKENKRLEEVGDRRNQELVCAKDDLSMAKSSKDEMSKLLDEIRGQAAAESALASQAESRRKSESEAAARREAELKSQVYHLEKALERLSTGSKHVLKKAGEVHLNFDPSPGKS